MRSGHVPSMSPATTCRPDWSICLIHLPLPTWKSATMSPAFVSAAASLSQSSAGFSASCSIASGAHFRLSLFAFEYVWEAEVPEDAVPFSRCEDEDLHLLVATTVVSHSHDLLVPCDCPVEDETDALGEVYELPDVGIGRPGETGDKERASSAAPRPVSGQLSLTVDRVPFLVLPEDSEGIAQPFLVDITLLVRPFAHSCVRPRRPHPDPGVRTQLESVVGYDAVDRAVGYLRHHVPGVRFEEEELGGTGPREVDPACYSYELPFLERFVYPGPDGLLGHLSFPPGPDEVVHRGEDCWEFDACLDDEVLNRRFFAHFSSTPLSRVGLSSYPAPPTILSRRARSCSGPRSRADS